MKLVLALFAFAALAGAQAYRVDSTVQTTNSNCTVGTTCPALVVPGATVTVCYDIACASPAATFTDASASVGCPINAPLTNVGSGLCSPTADTQGNFGFWVHSQTYYYFVTYPAALGGQMFGPYSVTPGVTTSTFDIPGNFASTNPDVTSFMAINANVNLNGMSPEALRYEVSLINGYRPVAVNGAMIVPVNTAENSVVYEADALAGIIIGDEPNVNNVALSGFAFAGNDSPNGTANQSGNTLTRLTGPPFDLSWCPPGTQPATPLYINTIFYVNGADNFCTGFVDSDHITLQNAATVSNVIWAKRKFFWGINTAVADNIVGINGNVPGGYKYSSFSGWENDINVYNTTTQVIGSSYGGGSLVNPALSIAYLVNTLGPGSGSGPIVWQAGYESLPGTADVFAEIGPTCMTSNCGSQPITIFSYTSAGYGIAANIATSPNGDLNFNVGSGSMHGENPQFVWEGPNGLILGLSGNVGVDHAVLEGGTNTRFQPGHGTLSALMAGGGGAGAMVYCDDCKSVAANSITAGTVCQGSGSGAFAIFVQAIMECF